MMESNAVLKVLDLINEHVASDSSRQENLQVRIRDVINDVSKQQKTAIDRLPVSGALKTLLHHIAEQDAKLDTMLLAGTCVVRILCQFLSSTATTEALRQLLSFPLPTFLSPNTLQHLPSYNGLHTTPSKLPIAQLSLWHLCLIHGCLSSGSNIQFLTIRASVNGLPFVLELLEPLVSLVHSCEASRFHTASELLLWLNIVRRLSNLSPSFCKASGDGTLLLGSKVFTPLSTESALVLSAVDANWESSVNGVSDLIRRVYQALLQLTSGKETSQRRGKWDMSEYHKFLLQRTMSLGWKTKPKFLSLACLLQFVSFEECLKMDSNFSWNVMRGLQANHLVSSAADVYKASLMFGCQKTIDTAAWSRYWKKVILETIMDNDRVCMQNLVTHVLPWTLENVSNSFEELTAPLRGNNSEAVLLSLVTLARIAKQVTAASSTTEDCLLDRCLRHESNAIRAEAFSLLCSCHLKSKLPAWNELNRVCEFVEHNLNVDDPWFRTRLNVQLESLVVRIRECLLTLFVRSRDPKKKVSLDDSFFHALEVVDQLVKMAVRHLFPGAGYQRSITSLAILQSILGTFCRNPTGKRKTAHKRESLEAFLQYEKENCSKLRSNSGHLRTALLHCLFHNVEEVRLVAFSLLTKELPNFLQTGVCPETDLWSVAQKCLSSPRPQDSAIGALLMHLSAVCLKNDGVALLNKLTSMCDQGFESLAALQRDPVSSSVKFPIHGSLLALTTCLDDIDNILSTIQQQGIVDRVDYVGTILNRAMNLAKSALLHVLLVMVPKNKQNVLGANLEDSARRAAPSFEDTNCAFLELIQEHERARGNPYMESERQLLVEKMTSCCWLCIKNSCGLLEQAVRISLEDNDIHFPLSHAALRDVADTFVSVMTGCRHRGAVESCCESLKSFCNLVSHCEDAEVAEIPFKILKEALESLTMRSKSSSVTRRSAGLPLLARALLEGESRSSRRGMQWAVEQLEGVARTPLVEGDDGSCVDLPQAEALHVLCALVGAASLGCAVLPHLGHILELCFWGLGVPSWLVRNAAHQLYGVTVPQTLGQKKTRAEFSGHDTPTAAQLFARYPQLRDFFLERLEAPEQSSLDLYFVLDFLSRLKPVADDWSTSGSLEPFLSRIRKHFVSRTWKLRLLAAKCSVLFCTSPKDEIVATLSGLKAFEDISLSNKMHAQLHAVNLLLKSNPSCVSEVSEWFADEKILSRTSWLLSSQSCFLRMEYLEMLGSLFHGHDHAWKGNLYSEAMEILGCATNDCTPGGELWKRQQATWLLNSAADLCPSDVINILTVAERDADVMTASLEFLLHTIHHDSTRFDDGLWLHVAMTLAAYCDGAARQRSVLVNSLELLDALLGKLAQSGPVEPSLVHKCIRVSKHNTKHVATGGTTIRALSLTLWSRCLKIALTDQHFSCSSVTENSIHDWMSAVTGALTQKSVTTTTIDILWLHVAHSMRIFGAAAFEWASSVTPSDRQILESIFNILVQLLQDEDVQIRTEAAATFASSVISQQSDAVQPNIALEELFERMLSACGNTIEVVAFFVDKLKTGNSPANVLLQRHWAPDFSTGALFEQDNTAVCMEPTFLHSMLRDHLKTAVCNMEARHCSDLEAFFVTEGADVVVEMEAAIATLNTLIDKDCKPGLSFLGKLRPHQVLSALFFRADVAAFALFKCGGNGRTNVEEVATRLELERSRLLQLCKPAVL